jgi:osmotically-inducible protein OsmY
LDHSLLIRKKETYGALRRFKGQNGTSVATRLASNSKGGIEMKGSFIKSQRLLLALGSLALGASLMAMPVPRNQDNQQTAPDNTKKNKDQTSPTADQQKINPSDRAITQKIRKAVHDDTSLSTYAHNIKIIAQDGKVTLRGPVRSEDEKRNLQAKAVAVAGKENVTNQLEIAPSK